MNEGNSNAGEATGILRRMARSVLTLIEARMQLFALEFQTERLRFLDTLLKFAVAIAMAAVALLLGTFTLAFYVWHVAGFPGLLAMTGLFLLAAGFLLWRLRSHLRQSPIPFTRTLEEFRKDRACLTTRD